MSREPLLDMELLLDEREFRLSLLPLFLLLSGLAIPTGCDRRPAAVCSCKIEGELVLDITSEVEDE